MELGIKLALSGITQTDQSSLVSTVLGLVDSQFDRSVLLNPNSVGDLVINISGLRP